MIQSSAWKQYVEKSVAWDDKKGKGRYEYRMQCPMCNSRDVVITIDARIACDEFCPSSELLQRLVVDDLVLRAPMKGGRSYVMERLRQKIDEIPNMVILSEAARHISSPSDIDDITEGVRDVSLDSGGGRVPGTISPSHKALGDKGLPSCSVRDEKRKPNGKSSRNKIKGQYQHVMMVSPEGSLCPGRKDDLLTSLMFVSDGTMGQVTESNKDYATPNLKKREDKLNEKDDFQAVSNYQEWQVPDSEGIMGQSVMVNAPTTILLKKGETKQYMVMNKWKIDSIPLSRGDSSWHEPPRLHKWAGSACGGKYRSDLALQCDVCLTLFQTKNAFMIYKKDNGKNKTALDALYNESIRWMIHEKRIAEDFEITVDTNNEVHDRVHHHEIYRICFYATGRKRVTPTNTT